MFLLIPFISNYFFEFPLDLHSTMFLLIRGYYLPKSKQKFNLHSTMFLLIRGALKSPSFDTVYLHSTMFLLIPVT